MSEIERIPSAFEKTLQSVYAGELVTGRNHTADRIRGAAEEFIGNGKLHKLGRKGIRSAFVEQSSYQTFRGIIGDEDILFGLAVRTEGHFGALNNKIRSEDLAKLPIHLTLNKDWCKPAAVLTPVLSRDKPTMVVVGREVNDPTHLEEIKTIMLKSGHYTARNWLA